MNNSIDSIMQVGFPPPRLLSANDDARAGLGVGMQAPPLKGNLAQRHGPGKKKRSIDRATGPSFAFWAGDSDPIVERGG